MVYPVDKPTVREMRNPREMRPVDEMARPDEMTGATEEPGAAHVEPTHVGHVEPTHVEPTAECAFLGHPAPAFAAAVLAPAVATDPARLQGLPVKRA
jgi:hypothetical protein